jgi:hypothetical protein
MTDADIIEFYNGEVPKMCKVSMNLITHRCPKGDIEKEPYAWMKCDRCMGDPTQIKILIKKANIRKLKEAIL